MKKKRKKGLLEYIDFFEISTYEVQHKIFVEMMIFRRILSSILGLIVILASLYMIEAASYRLVEPYAKFRLNLCWGDYLDSEINPYLSKLPLDHFYNRFPLPTFLLPMKC